jgi:hypothetical protein
MPGDGPVCHRASFCVTRAVPQAGQIVLCESRFLGVALCFSGLELLREAGPVGQSKFPAETDITVWTSKAIVTVSYMRREG